MIFFRTAHGRRIERNGEIGMCQVEPTWTFFEKHSVSGADSSKRFPTVVLGLVVWGKRLRPLCCILQTAHSMWIIPYRYDRLRGWGSVV